MGLDVQPLGNPAPRKGSWQKRTGAAPSPKPLAGHARVEQEGSCCSDSRLRPGDKRVQAVCSWGGGAEQPANRRQGWQMLVGQRHGAGDPGAEA